jgi:hypothetical protein
LPLLSVSISIQLKKYTELSHSRLEAKLISH